MTYTHTHEHWPYRSGAVDRLTNEIIIWWRETSTIYYIILFKRRSEKKKHCITHTHTRQTSLSVSRNITTKEVKRNIVSCRHRKKNKRRKSGKVFSSALLCESSRARTRESNRISSAPVSYSIATAEGKTNNWTKKKINKNKWMTKISVQTIPSTHIETECETVKWIRFITNNNNPARVQNRNNYAHTTIALIHTYVIRNFYFRSVAWRA